MKNHYNTYKMYSSYIDGVRVIFYFAILHDSYIQQNYFDPTINTLGA